MKKNFLFITTLLSITLFIASCTKDLDEPSPGDQFPGVPSGDIVPIEQREAALTGSAVGLKSVDDNRKYWSFAESKALISGCGSNDELDLLAQLGYTSDTKLAFGTDGVIYVKQYGTITEAGGWYWSDESTKDGIILAAHPSVVFTFTVLNESEVVYASKQSGAYEDCNSTTIITYERMVYGACGNQDPNGLSSDINAIVSEEVLQILQGQGMVINTGCTPPDVQGSYVTKPHMVESTTVPGELPGSMYPDLFFTFSNQDQDNGSVQWDAHGGAVNHYGLGGFICGEEDRFTVVIMVDVKHAASTAIAKGMVMVSGVITPSGIVDYKQANYMLDNQGDPDNVFIPNNTGRVYYDGNGIASRTGKSSTQPFNISSLFWSTPEVEK